MRILIAGLSGAGKTTLALQVSARLSEHFLCKCVNADNVRAETGNWDFSIPGRFQQAQEMVARSDDTDFDIVVCDFIAPLNWIRDIFDADYSVWMNTVQTSQYSDTDELFEPFLNADCIITEHNEENVDMIVDDIVRHFFRF